MNISQQIKRRRVSKSPVRVDDLQNSSSVAYLDNDDEDNDYSCDQYCQLNNETLDRLKLNDPKITALDVTFDDDEDDDAGNIDWKRKGSFIASNTNLISISIDKCNDPYSIIRDYSQYKNAEYFFKAVSQNRSIKHIKLNGSPINVGGAFTILTPFFKQNINFRHLEMGYCLMNATDIRKVSSALSKFDETSLRKFDFEDSPDNNLDDKSAMNIVRAVAKQRNLRELSLDFSSDFVNKAVGKWIVEVGNMLQEPTSRLIVLNLGMNYIYDYGASVIGRALEQNTTLEKLSLHSVQFITSVGWGDIAKGLMNPDSSLEELDLSRTTINDKGISAIAHAISSNKTISLKRLNFSHMENATSEGWLTFFEALYSSTIALEMLDLDRNMGIAHEEVMAKALACRPGSLQKLCLGDIGITYAGAVAILKSLARKTKLVELDLSGMQPISSGGWVRIVDLLGGSNFPGLEKLSLRKNDISDQAMGAMARTLDITK